MLKQKILEDLKKAVEDLGYPKDDILLSIPKNAKFGDYTTNVALQLAKLESGKRHHSSEEIANKIVKKLKSFDFAQDNFSEIKVVGGFINFFIKPDALMVSLHAVCDYSALVNPQIELEDVKKMKILVEYAHPNTHKAFHIGHVRNITLGESIVRLLEASGNEVFRANYQGDIGLHVAKALWGIKRIKGLELKVKGLNVDQRQHLLGDAYVKGARAYDEDKKAKEEIDLLNKQLYAKDPKIHKLWAKTRQWSLDYFDSIYQKLGTKFDRLFFESDVEESGKKIVKNHLGKVFVEDQGAIIFKGEDYGLHNRVFITSAGNPTYEAKDIGLAYLEREEYAFDLALHVVGVDQSGYFQVMLRALSAIDDWFAGKEKHLAYGMVSLTSGKMSSRTGEVVTFDLLLSEVKKRMARVMSKVKTSKEIKDKEKQQIIDIVSIGAIKFAMLKFAPLTNITFDLEKSVSLQGDSGPYIQYTYARSKSVLVLASYNYQPAKVHHNLEDEERQLLVKIEHSDVFAEEASNNLHPNLMANYLLDLARTFNLFYQKHPIIKAGEKLELRLALTCAVAVILKRGLYLLGIEAPERM